MAKEAKKSVFDSIKEQLEKKSTGGGKKFFMKDGDEKRIRFLTDLEDAIILKFHESKYGTKTKISHPCLAYYGKKCPNCNNDELIETVYYVWQIYNYEVKDQQFMIYKANKCSPVPHMSKIYERKGTLTDRDYILSQTGSETNKTFMFDPGEPAKFKKKDVNLWTEEEVLELIKNEKYLFALGTADDEDEDEEEDEKPKPKKKKVVVDDDDEEETPKKKKAKKVVEEDYDDEDDD